MASKGGATRLANDLGTVELGKALELVVLDRVTASVQDLAYRVDLRVAVKFLHTLLCICGNPPLTDTSRKHNHVY
jgi:hypothetical protein